MIYINFHSLNKNQPENFLLQIIIVFENILFNETITKLHDDLFY